MAVDRAQQKGMSVAHAHLRYLNPFPRNLGYILNRYNKVLIPELNRGQLALLIRGQFAAEVISFPKLHARPFTINEIEEKINELVSQ